MEKMECKVEGTQERGKKEGKERLGRLQVREET